GTDASPAEGQGGVGQVGAVAGGDGQQQGGQNSSQELPEESSMLARRSRPVSSNDRPIRTGRLPVHCSGASRPLRPNSSVTVNWVASGPAARSSTAAISATCGPAGVRRQNTTRSMASLTRLFSADIGMSLAVSDSWHTNR